MRFGKLSRGITAGMLVVTLVSASPVTTWAASSGTTGSTTSSAGTQVITTLTFQTSSDSTLIAGDSSTINLRLYDQYNQPFSGNLTATLTAPDGTIKYYPISGSDGSYSVTGVNPSTPGVYTLTVNESFSQYGKVYTAQGNVNVISAIATTEGNLILNNDSQIKVTLKDSNGNLLGGKSFSVDATGVGLGNQNYTTLADGTCNIVLNPTQSGTVNFILGGVIIGSLAVGGDSGAKVQTSGALVLNYPSLITGKLLDSNGNPLTKTNLTLDETGINQSSQNCTTLNDGTFSISVTPTHYGQVNFVYGGNVIGSMTVQPTFVANPRIGANITDNPSMSVAVAKKGWTSAQNVILTRQDDLVDAMTSIPLSKKLDAPILMTNSNTLSSGILDEIKSLNATDVYIIGGTGAVSTGIENTLSGEGLNITRLGGSDRYATAALIAQRIGNTSSTAYLAYGSGEPDAIVGSVFAAEQGYPVLLTATSSLPTVTSNYLSGSGAQNLLLLGGTGVISTSLEKILENNHSVTRLGGSDRFYTEEAVAENYFSDKPASDQYPIFFASANVSSADVNGGIPDASALLAGALAAKQNGILMIVPSSYIPDGVNNFLLYNKVYVSQSTVVGNMNAVKGNLETELESFLSR